MSNHTRLREIDEALSEPGLLPELELELLRERYKLCSDIHREMNADFVKGKIKKPLNK